MRLRPPDRQYECFAVTAPGLAPLVRRELAALHIRAGRVDPDGVPFAASPAELYAANLWLRVASRVLVRAGDFHATAFHALERQAARVPWARYLATGTGVRLRVTCRKSRLYHSDAVAERVLHVITDATGAAGVAAGATEVATEVGGDALAQLITVRFVHDRCTVSVDASGAALHRRGYRQATAKAPLRETLAAALLLASDWDGRAPLVDPMCGAGTIAIEAALLARGRAPGWARSFAFQQWPEFDAAVWTVVAADARARERTPSVGDTPAIYASDRDAGAIVAARANADRAGVAADIAFAVRPLSAMTPPPGPGWLVTNPPYGVRIGERDRLRDLYARLGATARAVCAGWTLAILSGDRALAGHIGVPLAVVLRTTNGGLPVELRLGRVPGSGDLGHP